VWDHSLNAGERDSVARPVPKCFTAELWEATSFCLRRFLAIFICLGLSSCGLGPEQRGAAITFGRSLDAYGQLLAEESTYIRSEVEAMRVLAVSLPNQQSESLFNQADYERLANGVQEPRIQRLVQIGGAASNFGKSLADVADLTSSTASEKVMSAAARQLALTAGAIGNLAAGVSVGAAGVNFITFVSTQAYGRWYLRQELPAAEPAFRLAENDIAAAFDHENANSLISMFTVATGRLATLLQASQSPSNTLLSAGDREIVASSYRQMARNRDHLKYVTSRQLELVRKGSAAYDAVMAAVKGDNSHLSAVESYSAATSQVRLAFQSLQ
jgi:hypothetical protein